MPTVQNLQDASQSFFDYYKLRHRQIQEIQMMHIANGDRWFVASNWAAEVDVLPNPLTNFGVPTTLARITAATPKVAAGKSAKSLVQLSGISTDEAIIHAEQALLMVLAHKLSGGESVGNVVVAGRMDPCSVCREVLDAFSHAYDVVYGRRLHFNRSMAGRPNHNKAEIKSLSLSTLATDNNYTNATFASFVSSYQSHLTMNGKARG